MNRGQRSLPRWAGRCKKSQPRRRTGFSSFCPACLRAALERVTIPGMFVRSRIFQRSFFLKELKTSVIVEALAQISYSPRGWSASVVFAEPIEIWDPDYYAKLMGVDKETAPFGILREKSFKTELQAMRFITQRLAEHGWDPTENWVS